MRLSGISLDAEDPTTLTDLVEYFLAEGNVELAERYAAEALQIEPQHVAALTLMGNVALRRGQLEEARQHAAWALGIEPTSEGALHLLAGVKARRNFFMGLWWRYQIWMSDLGSTRAIMVLLFAFMIYRLLVLVSADMGKAEWGNMLQIMWLGICAYTWFAPVIFEKSLRKEMQSVVLRKDF